MFKINFLCWFVIVLSYVQPLWFWSDLISYSTKLYGIYGNAICTRCWSLGSSEAGPLSLDNLVWKLNIYRSLWTVLFIMDTNCLKMLGKWSTLKWIIIVFIRKIQALLQYFKRGKARTIIRFKNYSRLRLGCSQSVLRKRSTFSFQNWLNLCLTV